MKKALFLPALMILLSALLATGALAADFDLPASILEDVDAAVAETAVYEAPALAAEPAGEDTVITGSCGTNLTYRLENGVLTVSGTGKMGAGNPWNTSALRETIHTVILEEGVTTVSGSAFMKCVNLSSLTLPSTLTIIDTYAFAACTSLTEVTIPGSVTEVRGSAFSGCTALRSAVIEKNAGMTLGNGSFYNCKALTSVSIGEGTTGIGSTAFQNCESLESVYLPDSVANLGTSTFESCTALMSVRFSPNLVSIPEGCFELCSALTAIDIPDSVTRMGNWAFRNCDALSVVALGNGLSYIGLGVFAQCDSLPYVILSYSVTEMSNGIFADSAVTEVRFRGNAPLLGDNMFENLNLTVYYPDDAEGWTWDIMKEYNAESVVWKSYTVCPDGHTVEPGKDVVVDATLFAPGEIIHTCRVCGKTFVDPIPVRTEPNDADIAAHDINGDEKADAADLPALMKLIADVLGELPAKGDLNGDGKVDILDVIRLVRFLAAFA